MVGHLRHAFAQTNALFGIVLVTIVCGNVRISMVVGKDFMCTYRHINNYKGNVK